MSTSRTIHALLVGIDAYPPVVPTLHGCRNDVSAVEALLTERVTRTGDRLEIRTLADEAATRDAVIAGFTEHLARARAGDVALFYYSGHGSQEPAPEEFWHLEPDRRNETLVLWDSRTEGGWDLADKELAALLTRVAAPGPHVLVVLDCCHSGSGTRAVLEDGIASRRAPADTRTRPLASYLVDLARLDDIVDAGPSVRSALGGSGWSTPRARHVLLAGCLSNETSKEIRVDGVPRGAMSAALESTLRASGRTSTYREIHREVSAAVRTSVRQQSPQLETSSAVELDEPFLGGAIVDVPRWFVVTRTGADWVMDGGSVHGILAPVRGGSGAPAQPGQPVRPAATTVAITDTAGSVVGTADVTAVRAGESTLTVTSGSLDPARSYRATVTATPAPPLLVRLMAGTDDTAASDDTAAPRDTATDRAAFTELRDALVTAAREGPGLVAEAGAGDQAELRVVADARGFALVHEGSRRAVCPRAATVPEALAMLEHIATWRRAMALRGPATGLPPDAVTFTLVAQPDPGRDLPVEVDGGYRLEYLGGDPTTPRGYTVTLTNTTQQVLWVALVDLTDTYGVYADAIPQGCERLEAGQSTRIDLRAEVPDELWEQGVTEVTDVLKLIVSTEEFDPRPMTQPDLDVSAPATRVRTITPASPTSSLDAVLLRVATRRVRPLGAGGAVSDWYCTDHTIVSVRPRPGRLTGAGAPVDLAPGVRVLGHPSLRARLELTTMHDATRDLSVPPVPEVLQQPGADPFDLSATRDGLRGGQALVVQAEPAQVSAVTSAAPLVVRLDQGLAPGEHLLPYAWDGEFYIPLGHSRPAGAAGGTDLVIERLPTPVVTTRSLIGSIRILVRKIAAKVTGRPSGYPTLRLATVAADGTLRYEDDPDAVRVAVAGAASVLLYVHGILGDTEGMVRSSRISGAAPAVGDRYGVVLTFDYENLDTPIEENAASLGELLAAAGLRAGHGKGLDVIAHSMGGLVCRHLIERVGGVDVRRLVALGVPNAGSPWPSVQQWATAAVAFAANGMIPLPWPVGVLAAAIGLVEKVDTALDQMQPGSDFLKQLATAPDPHTTYHVIAGDRSLRDSDATDGTRGRAVTLLRRCLPSALAAQIADLAFLNAPNDLAVSVASASALPVGRQPAPVVRVVGTDHLRFFEDASSLTRISDVLTP